MSFDLRFKIGDVLPNSPHMGMCDLMPIDYTDVPIHKDNGTFEKFGTITLPDSAKPAIQAALNPLKEKEGRVTKFDLDYRVRSKTLNLNYMLSKIEGGEFLYRKWLNKGENVPSIDLRHVTDMDKLLLSSSIRDLSVRREDRNLVSQGVYDVGTGLEPYASFALACADATTMDGPLTFRQNTVITETAGGTWSNDTAGFALSILNNSPPVGDITSGHKLTVAHSARQFVFNNPGSGSVIFKDFNAVRTVAGGFQGAFIRTESSTSVYDIHDFFFDGGSLTGEGIRNIASTAVNGRLYNFILFGVNTYGFRSSGGQLDVENGLVYNCGIGFDGGNGPLELNNVSSFSNTTDFQGLGSGGATISNTASSDATSPNNPSLTAANEMELNTALANFGDPKSGSTVENGGRQPIKAIVDMYGVAYGVGKRPIGPKIFPSVAGGGLLGSSGMDGLNGRYFNSAMTGGMNG